MREKKNLEEATEKVSYSADPMIVRYDFRGIKWVDCLRKKDLFCGSCLTAYKNRTSLNQMVFKRNANAFSLNAIVNVRRRHHEMVFLISQKLLKLATSKFDIA